MKMPCGCCEGARVLTPLPIWNRPGLGALAYRVGTHATFLETMKARLSNLSLDLPLPELDRDGKPKTVGIYPLRDLNTRDQTDPSIAFLDAWATVADVLTFYQERIANEGYLRTCTERRSILELARLVGYNLRPGVAASVYLAFTLDKGSAVEIPAGARAQSVPAPGEQMQTFETAEPLKTREAWNNLQLRMTQPQEITSDYALKIKEIYLEGVALNLKTGDPMLLVFGQGTGKQVVRQVQRADPQFKQNRTCVTFQTRSALTHEIASAIHEYVSSKQENKHETVVHNEEAPTNDAAEALHHLLLLQEQLFLGRSLSRKEFIKIFNDMPSLKDHPAFNGVIAELEKPGTIAAPPAPSIEKMTDAMDLIGPLLKPSLPQPANSLRLARTVSRAFEKEADNRQQIVMSFFPALEGKFYSAWANAAVNRTPAPLQAVYVLRVQAPLFGYNAGIKWVVNTEPPPPVIPYTNGWSPGDFLDEQEDVLFLDAAYEGITAGDQNFVIMKRSESSSIQIFTVKEVEIRPRTAYGISGKTTKLTLSNPWWQAKSESGGSSPIRTEKSELDGFKVIQNSIIYAQSERLPLAERPISTDVGGKTLELEGLYEHLQPGRWLIVSGERMDVKDANGEVVAGIMGSELVMLSGVRQDYDRTLPGDKVHSTLILANSLTYQYKRDTVTTCGNVVKASHGETRQEVCGSGDGSKALQQFSLMKSPLTYLPVATPAGIESSLKVLVNEVQWHEADSLAGLGPTDTKFITKTDGGGKTTVTFGNGKRGLRLPTGAENVRAVYRSGIGKGGNVKEGQISLLATRPLGVKAVTNPLCAFGGADREGRDQARRNAPLPTMALDRLVSVQDYADFSRSFAGIGKASAVRLSDGHRQLVHITIAGVEDVPIDVTLDLYRNLCQALSQQGDPFQPIRVNLRELLLLVISANIRLWPDYQWESVEPQIRDALLDAFSFERRELGQSLFLSEVVSVVQQVAGVAYVDVDFFGRVAEKSVAEDLEKLGTLTEKPRLSDPIRVNLAEIDPTVSDADQRIRPAQIAYLTPAVPETLVLNEVKR